MSEYFRKPIVKTLMLKGQEGQSIKEIKKTGTSGLVDTYTITLTDGKTSTFTVTNGEKGDIGDPTNEQTNNAVKKWLDEHPEATTTVQDHSLSVDKMIIGTLGFVTPEMFGAIGDGVTDDTDAIQSCIRFCETINVPILLTKQYKVINTQLIVSCNLIIRGYNAKLIYEKTSRTDLFEGLFRTTNRSEITFDGVELDLTVTEGVFEHGDTNCRFQIFWGFDKIRLLNAIVNIEGNKNQINLTEGGGFPGKELSIKNSYINFNVDTIDGGIVWLSPSSDMECKCTLENSVFESKTHDEIIALFGSGKIDAVINNCKFIIKECTSNPQIIVTISANNGAYSAVFEKCEFVSEVQNNMSQIIKIENKTSSSSSKAKFINCNFDILASEGSFLGGEQNAEYDSIDTCKDNLMCDFVNCTIKIRNGILCNPSTYATNAKFLNCDIIVNGEWVIDFNEYINTISPCEIMFYKCRLNNLYPNSKEVINLVRCIPAQKMRIIIDDCYINRLNLENNYNKSIFVFDKPNYSPTLRFTSNNVLKITNCVNELYVLQNNINIVETN